MCDQYDNRGCEVVDEKDMVIDNLESEIDTLNARIRELEKLLPYEKYTDLEIYNTWCDY